MGFEDHGTALNFRDWMRTFIATEIQKVRPSPRYALVVSVNRITRKAVVKFTGESTNTTVSMGSSQPAFVGQKVLVGGPSGDRFIQNIFGSVITHNDTDVAFWKFSNTITVADPGVRYLRLNSATLSAVTHVAIKHTDASDTDVSRILHQIGMATTKVFLTISKSGDPTKVAIYKAASYTENTSWDDVLVTYVYSAGSFTLDDVVRVTFQLTA